MNTKVIVLISCLMTLQGIMAAPAPTPFKPVSQFTFQSMQLDAAMMEDDCDACGCSAAGGSMGFSSMIDNNFVGVRYFYQSYSSREGYFSNSPWIDENFNTTQIWARIPLSPKIQITALVPYQDHTREFTAGSENISGLGDITVMATYTVFETMKDTITIYNRLQLGGGVKLPTGKFDASSNSGLVNQGFQVGTGSLDYLLLAEHQLSWEKWGLNSMLNYNLKTENKKNYQFGNQFNYGSTLFYMIKSDKMTYVPQLGIAGEVYQSNWQLGQSLPNTSGDIFFSKIGIEVGRDKFSLGANVMLPINQNLAGGLMKSNYRLGLNLNYSL
ncbi:transporter family protein [Flavobacterium algicola]|uniref:transporter n=1 Tax=Flavobacterium algicola TaxID=556529 RepID=UPI001EFC86A1|nr:transporter [Flavobacterium algicola]MCG9791272.1 transporter [Flavobacterium algicola]